MRRILLTCCSLLLIVAAIYGFLANQKQQTRGVVGSGSKVPTGLTPKIGPAEDPVRSWQASGQIPPSRESLGALAQRMKSIPPDDALKSIEAYLRAGDDSKTTLDFQIGSDGLLTGWPTLRTFLIDLLLEIDPAAASRISRDILDSPTTADEWAIALRNVGRVEATAGARDFLKQKTEELIRKPDWQDQPSIGYLNAFDLLVYTEATTSAPLLSEMVRRKDRRDLAHAGFLTLDRLVQRKPEEMLAKLAADTALHASRPEMVAQQFARADLRDPAQRTLVKSWMLEPARTPLELRTFAETYPNNNQMISQNLLTRESQLSGSDLAAHDREAMVIIKGWQADPSLQPLSSYLQTIASRLAGFSNESGSSPTRPSK